MQRRPDKVDKPLGRRILITSFAVGVVGVTPLLLYMLFGPSDGNPIGLGLLAVVAAPISVGGMALGAIVMAARYLFPAKG
jgi:hypothetical protein